jgi:hypothetical protein
MTIEADKIESITPGRSIRCTVSKMPVAKAPRDTIARLMRLDPVNRKALRRAQELRRKRMHTYIRGNRLWHSREKAARVVYVRDGASWEMPMTPQLADDLKSVAPYLTIEQA